MYHKRKGMENGSLETEGMERRTIKFYAPCVELDLTSAVYRARASTKY
jgi:hypothetical protein